MPLVIGEPGQPARMIVDGLTEDEVSLNINVAEVAIETLDMAPVRISDAGDAVEEIAIGREEKMRHLRATRYQLLAASDLMVLVDRPMADGERDAWLSYRQQLRDLPDTIDDPDAVVWPEPPTA